jgi:hypothetical protein
MSEWSFDKVLSVMKGPFPMLETLQLYCWVRENLSPSTALPSEFEAPNLRHLQLSDLKLLPPSTKLFNNVNANRPSSIVSFSLGEITTNPVTLMASIALMPHLKVLKIGVSFSIPSESTEMTEYRLCTNNQREPEPASLTLTDLEEFEFQGIPEYLEPLVARISAPFLKKMSITVTSVIEDGANLDITFKYLSRLIGGAASLAFQFARVRFKDGLSIVMDRDELWTGRGAFELKFNRRTYYFDANLRRVANICRVLTPSPETVQSLLLEDGHRNSWDSNSDCKGWDDLFRVFDNIKTLRVAGRFVDELDEALKLSKSDGEGLAVGDQQTGFLPMLQEIVQYGPEKEFADFVKARQDAGSPVRVVSGPRNRLTLF